MNVYAESNFVLELVLEQEQHASCEMLVSMAEREDVTLVLPAFSLFEPFTTLYRRQRERNDLHDRVQRELAQLARTKTLATEVSAISLPALLVRSTQAAASRFNDVLGRRLRIAQVIPLTDKVLEAARAACASYGFDLPDGIVFASVAADLATRAASDSCFLNRNTKDFADPAIVTALSARGCKMMGSFDAGVNFISTQAKRAGTAPLE